MTGGISAIDLNIWELFSTDIMSLSIRDTTMWMIKASYPNGDGHQCYIWDLTNQVWAIIDGGADTMTIGTTHTYARGTSGRIYWRASANPTTVTWSPMGPYATDIKAGDSDSTWWIGTTNTGSSGYDFNIVKYTESTGATATLSPGAVRVGPSPDGNCWFVNSQGFVYQYTGSTATQISGAGTATDIIVGSDGIPFIVSATTTTEGYTIQKWNSASTSWTTLSGIGGVSLGLDVRNNPYVITSSYEVYRMKNIVYDFCPSKLLIIISDLLITIIV